jgi:hypothetical protein
MAKKSQISFFLILSFVILIAAGFIYYLSSPSNAKNLQSSPSVQFDADSVGLFVQNCIELTVKNGLMVIAKNGGYHHPKYNYLSNINLNYSFYIDKNIDLSPSLETIEKEISAFVNRNLIECLDDFSVFKEFGYEVNQGSINSTTKILSNSVLVEVEFPISARKADLVKKFNKFSFELTDFHLKGIYPFLR